MPTPTPTLSLSPTSTVSVIPSPTNEFQDSQGTSLLSEPLNARFERAEEAQDDGELAKILLEAIVANDYDTAIKAASSISAGHQRSEMLQIVAICATASNRPRMAWQAAVMILDDEVKDQTETDIRNEEGDALAKCQAKVPA